MRNAMTIDVEDYFQVATFSRQITPAIWDRFPLRVEPNIHRLLDLFDEQDVRVTFFVLGWIAEQFPSLVRTIVARHHEIACYGYSHQLIYRQTPKVFREETARAKACLEDQAQQTVWGYRATRYSITQQSPWVLDILVELGFLHDSSILPIHPNHCGILGNSPWPYRLATPNGGSIIEFPPSTMSLFGFRFPVAGGSYFRLAPYAFTRFALERINGSEGWPFIFCVRPWEIDPEQPRMRVGRLSTFHHYANLSLYEGRLRKLVKDFHFAPVTDVLKELPILKVHEIPTIAYPGQMTKSN